MLAPFFVPALLPTMPNYLSDALAFYADARHFRASHRCYTSIFNHYFVWVGSARRPYHGYDWPMHWCGNVGRSKLVKISVWLWGCCCCVGLHGLWCVDLCVGTWVRDVLENRRKNEVSVAGYQRQICEWWEWLLLTSSVLIFWNVLWRVHYLWTLLWKLYAILAKIEK